MILLTLSGVLLASFVLSVNGECRITGCPDNLQSYLTAYGYMNPNKTCIKEDLQAALRKFQELNVNLRGLQVTGRCDNITNLVLSMPRCGCEDIVKPETKMMPAESLTAGGPLAFRTFPTKWSKRELTWKVLQYPRVNTQLTRAQVDDAMQRALDIWAAKTSMTFREASSTNADITIKFDVRRHTSSPPFYDFDGRGGVLAHAFSPESGVVHFDDDEQYTLGNNQGTELYIVAAHEFGHTLGISHSNQQEALMAPYYRYSQNLQLHSDDIAAIQSLYGPPSNPTQRPVTTLAPTRPPVPTEPPVYPDHCKIDIKGAFKIETTTYVFSRERISSMRTKTFVYKVDDSTGIDPRSRTPIEQMFKKRSSDRYPRAYPYRVDAAAYIPDQQYVFLFSGTRAYRYRKSTNGLFYLDQDFPRWMDVTEFPERPRAAVAMPYSNYNAYYMLIFGTTMVWDWNFFSERVGAWAYPINVFGASMPLKMDSSYLQDRNYVVFFKGGRLYKFSLRYRRVLEEDKDGLDIKKDFLKGDCM